MATAIQVRCANERWRGEYKVVGHITLEAGEVELSGDVVWDHYRPVAEDYRLPDEPPGRGVSIRCPRCRGLLCVAAEVAEPQGGDREGARQRALAAAKAKGPVHHHIVSSGLESGYVPLAMGMKLRIK